ncbi:MAG: hypothetical protein IPO55_01570 [Alphaproteobacteria bacterium]|nr:hypothetical protein [Alphaproteobacteria bacterium]
MAGVQQWNAGLVSRGQERSLADGIAKGAPDAPIARGFRGAKAPDGLQTADGWSMGSTGSAEGSLGLPERVWVSGQERPDWWVSGANTPARDQPAKRLLAHKGSMPNERHCQRDATGERSSVSLAKGALSYNAHLALNLNAPIRLSYNSDFVLQAGSRPPSSEASHSALRQWFS